MLKPNTKNSRYKRLSVLSFIAFLVLLNFLTASVASAGAEPSPQPPRYAITNLGAGYPLKILNNGDVLGYTMPPISSPNSETEQEWIWRQGKRLIVSEKEIEQLLGPAYPGEEWRDDTYAACLKRDGKIIYLKVPTFVGKSNVVAINHVGQAVGSCVYGYGRHAAIWNINKPNSEPILLQPPSSSTSVAFGINDAGQVVGCAQITNKQIGYCFLWQKGHFTRLPSLFPGKSVQNQPAGIDTGGQVVGNDLAGDINNCANYPFFWVRGHLYELAKLLPHGSGWVLEDVDSINDKGQIVGVGSYHGQSCAFILTPDGST